MVQEPSEEEPIEVSDTGKILIRFTRRGEQFDAMLRNSQRLGRWIRERLQRSARRQHPPPPPSRR
jgi:hypothetical protein